jgi:hypothetical protein
MTPRYRITAIADSDSYLKLACTTLDRLGPEWERRVVLVRSPLLPTDVQQRAATGGTFMEGVVPDVVPAHRLAAELAGTDVVFAAATGPVAQEVFYRVASVKRRPRPALVSALPGVAYPATSKALRYRALGDAFIAHSHAETRAFADIAEKIGSDMSILLSRLPFLASPKRPVPLEAPVTRIVFAAQAKMPFRRTEREQLLVRLAAAAEQNPGVEVVVKLRALAGEPQTHRERHPYDALWADLVEAGTVREGSVRFATGSMDSVLGPGSALLTVSSTAVLEALDRGLPALILEDFGVSEKLLNKVFADSGLLGTLDDVEELRFAYADPQWLRENYFHTQHVPLGDLLLQFAERARAGRLASDPKALALVRSKARRARIRTALPTPVLKAVRSARKRLRAA